jgi:hypothetical protein
VTTFVRSALLASVIAVVPIVLAPAAAAEPASTEITRVTETFDYVTSDPCIGESVHIQGEITYVLRSVVTPEGNVLTAGHTIADMTAVGLTTGTQYTLVDSRQITTNILSATGEGFTGTGAWSFMLVGRGSGPNLIVTNQDKVTLTPDGQVAVSFLNIDVRCVG